MDVRNCKKCGRMFNYAMGPAVCPRCKEDLEEKFQEVKKYVYEHQGCGIQEVSDECEVSTQQIKQWLKEERLEFSSDSQVMINCEKCGAPIRSGRFCDKCKMELSSGFKHSMGMDKPKEPVQKPAKNERDKMRFLK